MANPLSTLTQDLRFALRQLRRAPGFAFTAIVTIALGIGANTAIFTLAHAILLRELPVKEPGQLYRIGDNVDSGIDIGTPPDQRYSGFSTAAYEQLRTIPEFVQLAAMQEAAPSPTLVRRAATQEEAKATQTLYVSGNFFTLFGLSAQGGRLLQPADDRAGASPVAVMSFATWAQQYRADPAVVGSTFLMDTRPVTVIGIAPEGFYGDRVSEEPPSFYLPLAAERVLARHPLSPSPEVRWLYLLGRVKPGTSLPTLQQKIDSNLRNFLSTMADYKDADGIKQLARVHAQIVPAAGGIGDLQSKVRSSIYVLAMVAGLVLLIACANVANLLLVRGATRRAELALRTALGAPQRRVLRQAITESVLLALLGGACGLAVAYAGTRAILALSFPEARFLPISASPSSTVLAFTFALSVLTGLVFGLIPALAAIRAQPADALRGTSRSMQGRVSFSQQALVVVQAMLSVVLISVAALLLRSFSNLQNQSLGLETENRFVVHIDPLRSGYTRDRVPAMMTTLQARLGALPGVQRVAFAQSSPLEGGALTTTVHVEGEKEPKDRSNTSTLDRVSPGFFATVGQPVLRGRDFSAGDREGTPLVAIVSQGFASHFFGNEDPLGKRFGIDPSQPGYTVIGVVGDAKYDGRAIAEAAGPMYFRPVLQPDPKPQGSAPSSAYLDLLDDFSAAPGAILLSSSAPPAELEQQVRRAMREVDPNLAIVDIHTLRAQLATQLTQQRTVARLTAAFGLLALLLASIGLYGVTAYSVAQRVPEIGLRMALGADRNGVLALVLRSALLQTLAGLLLGVPLALLAGHYLQSQLFGIGGHDALTLTAACAVLALSALVAAFIPARRASNIDPMQALRSE